MPPVCSITTGCRRKKNPAIRELLEQDRAFLDEKQVQMTLAREFYLAVRLKNEKPDTAYTLLSTIETKFRDNETFTAAPERKTSNAYLLFI